jgi:hypothetical protein
MKSTWAALLLAAQRGSGDRAHNACMRRASTVIPRAGLAVALLCMAPVLSAEEQPPPRDAAQIVQEGDVSQWLQHYQRERGAEWAKQQRAQPATPSPAPEQDQRPEGRD